MKIISMKRNENAIIDGEQQKVYEISYRKDESSDISNISIAEDSTYGLLIKDELIKLTRHQSDQETLLKLLVEAVEENSSIGVERTLDTVNEENEALSSRLRLVDGAVLKIGEHEVNGPLASQIMEMVRARRKDINSVKTDDWLSLVNFAELLYDNVDPYIREQLYSWMNYQIKNGRLTLTKEGKFLGYKGCRKYDNVVRSIHSGPGIVNGVPQNGHLDNSPGNVIEMAREAVDADRTVTCSTGLHIGTFDYAKSFGEKDALVLVEVDPRDVVSVPDDYNGQKIRACKYKVVKLVEDELTDFSLDFSSPVEDKVDDEIEVEDKEKFFSEKLHTAWANNAPVAKLVYKKDKVGAKEREYTNFVIDKIDSTSVAGKHSEGYAKFLFSRLVSIDGITPSSKEGPKFAPGQVITFDYQGIPRNEDYVICEVFSEKILAKNEDGDFRSFFIDEISNLKRR